MNAVVVGISHPDASCVKTPCVADDRGFSYSAAFYKETNGARLPKHRGPTITVQLQDEDGQVLKTETRTLMLKDSGDGEFEIVLSKFTQAKASFE